MMTKIPTSVKNQNLVKKRRDQIIRAAITCFSRKGYHKTTLEDLAQEAGISHGNIYKYINTKEDIFYLIHDHLFQSGLEDINRNLKGIKDPVEKLRRIIRSRFDLSEDFPNALLLLYQEANVLKGEYLKEVLENERQLNRRIEAVLEEGVEKGVFQDINRQAISNLLITMVDCWELKRWDLRKYLDRYGFESVVADTILRQIKKGAGDSESDSVRENSPLGSTVLIVNGGGSVGHQLISTLLHQGEKVITFADQIDEARFNPVLKKGLSDNLRIFSSRDAGSSMEKVFEKTLNEAGGIEKIIYCLGEEGVEPTGEVSLTDRLFRAQTLAPVMIRSLCDRSSGHLVFIAPDYWESHTSPHQYATVKGGVVSLVKALAQQTVQTSVNVNGVVPGYTRRYQPSGSAKDLNAESVVGRHTQKTGDLSDIVNTVLFLTGNTARYITGQIIHVTGGDQPNQPEIR